MLRWCDSLSLAVLALAVDDMNDLESVMTSARPLAFLHTIRLMLADGEVKARTFDHGKAQRA